MSENKMKISNERCQNPYDPQCMSSLKHWGEPLPPIKDKTETPKEVVVDCGWGRLIFGQTFSNHRQLAEEICKEKPGHRDIAMYMREPHVVISYAPQELFMDPSLTYRLDYKDYRENRLRAEGLSIRPVQPGDNETTINAIYKAWGMVPNHKGFCLEVHNNSPVNILVAEDLRSNSIVGAVTGVDHVKAFNDPDNGSSLWALAVDNQCGIPGVGESLVRELILHFIEQGRRFLDLSVMHTNKEAIALYDNLGFKQVPVYCIKKKNSINEPLFTGPATQDQVNIYAGILIEEARRRGINVEILDGENGYFKLTFGSRSIVCRESLSELTSAVAMSRCDDKAVTMRILQKAQLNTAAQRIVTDTADYDSFLKSCGSVVVKPAQGEQGQGVFVDLRTKEVVAEAIKRASSLCEKVIIEEYVKGEDLRIIVIDDEVVAAAVRRPATVFGTGQHTIRQLIEKQSRRRAKATHGESTIPLDEETIRCIKGQGYRLDQILPKDKALSVRKTANLHTGGTIHDVTEELNPKLTKAAIAGARALDIPVVGFDFLVPNVEGEDYVIIEANERPGLANHEPQPTAEKFIDLLFPQTRQVTQ